MVGNSLIAKELASPKNSIFSDEWISDDDLKGQKGRSHPVFKKDSATAYIAIIQEGIVNKKIIDKIQDFSIFTMNN